MELIEIAARHGGAVRLRAGQSIRVVNIAGGQVADLWAFPIDDPAEHLSMPHSIVCLGRIKPAAGDMLVTNLRRPILELVEDSSPGVHCMLFAACDKARYELLGCVGHHANCADNLRHATAPLGLTLSHIPTPLNLFMNTKIEDHAVMTVEAPEATPGDSVTFRAVRDCLIVLSACPQDMLPVNGRDCIPKPIGYAIMPDATS